MSHRSVVALLLLCTLIACGKGPPAPAAPKAEAAAPVLQPARDTDADNLLNLMYGAAVVWRGGEHDLESSAVHALDGFLDTTWTSAPGSPEETLIFSTLATTRIQRVGATLVKDMAIESVAFDASMDGKTWRELATLKLENNDRQQLVDVKPTDARYLRVRTIDPTGRYYVRVRSFHAMGEEVEPPRTPSFSGCWMINGVPAHLEQNGARITGVIETRPPTYLDGGTDNRVGLVMWMQDATWGHAVLTRTPDGERISGLTFHEEIDSTLIGAAWFGSKCDRLAAGGPAAGPAAFLNRARKYSLYGLAFDRDDRIIEEVSAPALDALVSLVASSSQRLRVVAHEHRYDTPEQNQQHAGARLQALRAALQARGVNPGRIDFVAAGSDSDGPSIRSALQRSALSRVDLLFGS